MRPAVERGKGRGGSPGAQTPRSDRAGRPRNERQRQALLSGLRSRAGTPDGTGRALASRAALRGRVFPVAEGMGRASSSSSSPSSFSSFMGKLTGPFRFFSCSHPRIPSLCGTFSFAGKWKFAVEHYPDTSVGCFPVSAAIPFRKTRRFQKTTRACSFLFEKETNRCRFSFHKAFGTFPGIDRKLRSPVMKKEK